MDSWTVHEQFMKKFKKDWKYLDISIKFERLWTVHEQFMNWFKKNKNLTWRTWYSYSLRLIGKMHVFCNFCFFATSGVQLAQPNRGLFHFHRASRGVLGHPERKSRQHPRRGSRFTYQLKHDGTPITSKRHTHLSHSETSRLLTSSLSLGVPVPRSTQCIRVV